MTELVKDFSCALIVATYDDPTGLEGMLRSIQRQTVQPTRVYVADDGSDKRTLEIVRRFSPVFSIEHVWQQHQGFRKSSILNRAIARATEDYLIFVDGDELLHRRFVEDHRIAAANRTAILGTRCHLSGFNDSRLSSSPSLPGLLLLFCMGCVKRPDRNGPVTFRNRLASLKRGLRLWFRSPKTCSYRVAVGGNMAAWKNDMTDVNGFDEDFLGWGHEDVDLIERMSENGVRTMQLMHRAICFHVNHPIRSENPKNVEMQNTKRPTVCLNGITRPQANVAQYSQREQHGF